MSELAQFVPKDIDFSILASLFGSQGVPIGFVGQETPATCKRLAYWAAVELHEL